MAGLQRHPLVETAVRYHQAVARGAVGEELAGFFHEDVVQREYPNVLIPGGAVRDLPAILEAAERGRGVLRCQRFDVLNAVAVGDQVALEVDWAGTLAVALGDLPSGHVLRARIAVFLEFRDGRIIAQRNYDCYERLRSAGQGEAG
ncbi:nuclear transport factor 2 family protein [Streptomyces albofaciens JCM 4342]|uniref:nuclear transport factor 2 family protein n=1 Tax=Streptomyces albofaciens TaxID=66866 RepID=UPI00123BEAB6|nr:nuclear transport factor 2 family protein [Streptomyces albofaciens]KAA6215480.1 nuclear transport factor 2 family protein [Streptomyces albofaciens JCM 4342]